MARKRRTAAGPSGLDMIGSKIQQGNSLFQNASRMFAPKENATPPVSRGGGYNPFPWPLPSDTQKQKGRRRK